MWLPCAYWIVPSVGTNCFDNILRNVDLPQPLAPRIQYTPPSLTLKSTLSNKYPSLHVMTSWSFDVVKRVAAEGRPVVERNEWPTSIATTIGSFHWLEQCRKLNCICLSGSSSYFFLRSICCTTLVSGVMAVLLLYNTFSIFFLWQLMVFAFFFAPRLVCTGWLCMLLNTCCIMTSFFWRVSTWCTWAVSFCCRCTKYWL